MEEERSFRSAAKKLLFGEAKEEAVPGAGRSAAEAPERHLRIKVTMNLDGDIVVRFKERAKEEGKPYQSLINQALREYLDGSKPERMASRVGEMLLESPSFLESVVMRIQSLSKSEGRNNK